MDTAIYNYLVTNYSPKPVTKYDTHKTSELRSIVSRIAKITQTSPRYLIKMNEAKQKYALGVKESSMLLQHGLSELTDDSADGVFFKKKAYSSDNDTVNAKIITEDYDRLPEPFSLKIDHLATTQVNLGQELYSSGKGMEGGTYRFRANVGDDYYDFQYNVKKDLNHKELLEGLASFINKANIGLQADVMPIGKTGERLRMRIESTMTGSVGGENIFNLSDKNEIGGKGLVDYYGLNQVSQSPTSSSFTMDGIEKHTLSNEFTISKSLQLNLRNVTEDAVDIQYLPDSDLIMSGIRKVVDAYNYMVDSTEQYSKTTPQKMRLVSEMRRVFEPYEPDLESVGLRFDEDSKIQVDKSLAIQAINDGDMKDLFGKDSDLVQRLLHKTDEIKLNPMDYVDKTLVSYPNYSKPPVGSAYVTSLYSGLLFNFYC